MKFASKDRKNQIGTKNNTPAISNISLTYGKDRHPPSDVEFIITRGVSHVHIPLTRQKLLKTLAVNAKNRLRVSG